MMIETSDRKRGEYPHVATGFNSWVAWMYVDGRKQPFSPWSDLPRHRDDGDDKFSWSNPQNFTDFQTAREWARKHPRLKGLGFILQHESDPYQEPADPLLFVDLDDVVDAESGAVHPFAAMLVERMDTYADLSVSGTGIHIIGVGELPEGTRTVQDDLPAHPDFPDAEIEVYDRKRFCAMTGEWLKASNREVTPVGYWVKRLTRRFSTTTKTGQDRGRPQVDIDNSAFADLETTDNYDELLDAVASVGVKDIRLSSTVTRERGDGIIDFDPAYRVSNSGTGLGWLPNNEVWIDRDGEHYLDALHLVALEESLREVSVTDYPSGKQFWKALERLRERGANIPRYEGKPADLHGFHKRNKSDDEQAKDFVKKLETI